MELAWPTVMWGLHSAGLIVVANSQKPPTTGQGNGWIRCLKQQGSRAAAAAVAIYVMLVKGAYCTG